MDWMAPVTGTIVSVALLVGVTVTGLRIFGVPRPLAPLLAIVRGAIQLALLSVVLAGIIKNPVWVGLALTVMFAAAVFTASRRIRASSRQASAIGLAMLAGNLVVLGIVFASGALEFSPRYVLAIGGIIVGNTMTTASLTGRAFHSSVHDHWDEVEGWLALGATPIESTRELARSAVFSAMVPSIDQTKTTGIVVLPGAFVGAIFGGASPLEAGRFQIVVLAGILAAGTLTAIIMLRLIGAVAVRPVPESFTPTSRSRIALRR